MPIPLFQVDAFTTVPFAGNPAGVCFLDASVLPMAYETRQKIAAEMNLSETAFLEVMDTVDDKSESNGSSTPTSFTNAREFRLRWFTPAVEVPLCGHATLAAAKALITAGNKNPSLRFLTEAHGWLTVEQVQGGSEGQLRMTLPCCYPKDPPPMGSGGPDTELLKVLLGDMATRVKEFKHSSALLYMFVVLDDDVTRQELQALTFDFPALKAAYSGDAQAVCLTLQDDGVKHDIYSRFFAPWSGIDEDPVTGSSFSGLGPYWAKVLGKKRLRALQGSSRGGETLVDVDEAAGTVILTASAVVVSKGELYL